MRHILHVGCGSKVNKPPREYAAYKEVRLDCNKQVEPDLVASIVAMPMIHEESFDAVFASHVLEHLYCHEVAMALSELHRVLKPGGILDVRVPDLQCIGGKLAIDQADHAIYNAPIGVIAPLDMMYGHRGSIGAGNLFMGHRFGFTQSVLKRYLENAGFEKVEIDRKIEFELKAIATKKADSIFGVGGAAEGVTPAKTVEECTMHAEGLPNDDEAA
jgi:predicted SAM-dependent methyltransferase